MAEANSMHPITHIVAATDFSAPAEQAVRRGALIAKQLGAKLHLLHVVHPVDLYCGPELSFGAQRHYEQMQLRASKVPLDNLAATLREQYGIPVQVTSRIGNTHMEVARYAAANAGSLIVAGARGESESALLDILLGSTVTNLLRAATCSVLIVRNMVAEPYRQAILQ